MAGMCAIIDKLPFLFSQAAQMAPHLREKQLRRTAGSHNRMTPLTRRIAAGAGVTALEVNRILAQFEQMQKMMKMMKGGGVAKMTRGMQGMIPGLR